MSVNKINNDGTLSPMAGVPNITINGITHSMSNPNLLDNPFFTINQRGLSTYSVTGSTGIFTLDRWKMGSWTTSGTSKTSTINVGSDGIVFVAGVNYFIQTFESDLKAHLAGRTVTLSIDYESSTTGGQFGFVVGDAWESSTVISFKNGNYVDSKTFTFPTTDSTVRAWIYLPETNTNFKVHSVKLELGTMSTLENDTIPNYQQELFKCQRYFYKTKSLLDETRYRTAHQCIAINTNALSGTAFPVTMRTTPTVTVLHCHHMMGTTDISGTTVPIRLPDGVSYFMNTSNPFTIGAVYALDFEASAEL